ncbi:MAG: hypothetical protein A2Y88_08970 [Chloroflexi bacterium RBG_13_48_10]|jgi:hypothetical protein|nr:MAG: hypothetical protein A2Y88_08970 [Chloroflexi bacterium RBG_13_48_10]
MRLWSLHPSYLDSKGLVACWREGLLARKVLRGETKGYRNHPQLQRFRIQDDPVAAIDQYLLAILVEADQRGFTFDHGKIKVHPESIVIPVTNGQLEFELSHLRSKLKQRDSEKYGKIAQLIIPIPNPIFNVVIGGIENWEKILSE